MHFLIDADTALYKAGCSDEERWYEIVNEDGEVLQTHTYKKDATGFASMDPSLTIRPCKSAGPLKNALSNLKTYMNKIIEHDKCTSYEVFIGGEGNFRLDVDPNYKTSRDPLAKPIHLKEMKDYMVKKYKATRCDGMEADDVVSYLCQQDLENNCIVSVDKDLRNSPGWHFNPDTLIMDYVTEADADLNFYRQLLMGDSTDGIVGIAGYGKAKALALLPESLPEDVMCEAVWYHYQERGYDSEYFIQQARLLWMLREEGVMWEPPISVTNNEVES